MKSFLEYSLLILAIIWGIYKFVLSKKSDSQFNPETSEQYRNELDNEIKFHEKFIKEIGRIIEILFIILVLYYIFFRNHSTYED